MSDDTRWNYISTYMTTNGTDSNTGCSFTFPTDFSLSNDYYEWPKGISNYSTEKKYKPKWHITQGYKNQMNSMWD